MLSMVILLCYLPISSTWVEKGREACLPYVLNAMFAPHLGQGQLPQDGQVPPDSAYSPSFEFDKPRLDFFLANMQVNPNATLYVFVYGGRVVEGDEVIERIRCIRDYLTVRKGIDEKRVTVKDGGYRDRLTVEIFYSSTKRPEPTPTPSVDPQDVRRVKKTKKRSKCGPVYSGTKPKRRRK